MQLVIDIPEEEYKRGTLNLYFGCYSTKLHDTILNGTPLPKGHGRLIDADDLLDNTCIDEIPTIIEAEKEESHGRTNQ